ncbi:MAG: DUF554 domain-containing protein [Clostridiales bacterium]|nr:DUF554 domain-containing protein [Clostridiales bacterium]
MIGTLANVAAIVAGSLIGGLVKKILKEEYTKSLYIAMGLAASGLGINAVVQNMPDSNYPVLFIGSLALGSLIGTICKIDERVGSLTSKGSGEGGTVEDSAGEGETLEGSAGRNRLGEGIVTGSLLFCVGTLSILGPVQSALYHDYTYLFTNSMLDLVTSMVFAATYGVGMALAAGILFIWQGSIYALTVLLGDFITTNMMTELSIVGGFLILSSGLAILDIKDFKTLNMLPALVFPVIWCLIVG